MTRTLQRYVRLTPRHRDDFLPVVYWFLLAHAVGFLFGIVGQLALEAYGVTGTTTVTIIGGGHATEQTWLLAEFYAMQIQLWTFLMVFAAFALRYVYLKDAAG